MPENSRSYATFAEEPGGGSPDKEPFRGPFSDESAALEAHWRAFGKIATGLAVVTFPVFFLLLNYVAGMGIIASVITAILGVAAFRGLVDLIIRRLIPSPSLFNDDGSGRERDITDRRRTAFWRFWFKVVLWLGAIYLLWVIAILLQQAFTHSTDLVEALRTPLQSLGDLVNTPDAAQNAIGIALTVMGIFLVNTLIFLGPLMVVGIRQIRTIEPGDVDLSVHIDQVRGQQSAKEAIRRIVTLWQSGDEFEQAGGKRERGFLMIGPPGTGKTMLAKALARRFNAPIVLAPGPAFSQSFIGVDVMVVMWMAARARRLARKWGGQCIVFIDEIDALGGQRENVLAGGAAQTVSLYGPMGSLTSSMDLVLETPEWRDRLFAARAQPIAHASTGFARAAGRVREFVFPGLSDGGSGRGGLQQLLIEMDGVRTPGALRRWLVNRVNTLLDALFFVPTRIGEVSLRLPSAKPRKEDLFFVGACNVPRESLDPALTRPGRMGYTVPFQTPDYHARKDILEFYVGRIAHEAELASTKRLDELARVTMGYSPAMIEQAMSLALANAHHEHRAEASWPDVLRALTQVAWGDDRELQFIPDEEQSLAVHEAGHAVAGHVYMAEWSSSRLSIRPRGRSYGHHAMAQTELRHLGFRSHKFADLVWTLGAIAAEEVFYGETSVGVGGDLDHATEAVAIMVGVNGMRANIPDLTRFADNPGAARALERKLRTRFQDLGLRLMNRAHTKSLLGGQSLSAVLDDEGKRNEAAVFLGHAFMRAYWLISHNRQAVETVAETILEKKEMYGDEVVDLLNGLNITIPDPDPTDEANWPRL